MSRHEKLPEPFTDEFNLGQEAVARLRLESAEKGMADNHFDAFTTGYVNPIYRAAKRRIFGWYRSDYERAKAVLEVLQ